MPSLYSRNLLPSEIISSTKKECKRVIERLETERKRVSNRSIKSFLDNIADVVVERTSNVSGDEVKALLRKNLKLLRTMTKYQLQFTEVFTQCLLPFIYGSDFDEHEARIKEEHDIDELHQFALLCCPRRFGKSRIVAWFTACALVSIPNIVVTLFSPGKRQSYYLMEQIRKDVAFLDGQNPGKIRPAHGKNNKETYAIIVDHTERLVRGLPAKENTTRGTDGNFIVCEEAAVMPKIFFTDVVAPVAGPRTTGMVCISTISGSGDMKENWFTSLLNMRRPNGKSYFNTFKTILACDKCVEEGIADTCEHRFSELPHWHSEEKQLLLRAIYAQLGERDKMLQETVGIAQNESIPALEKQLVHRMFSRQGNPWLKDSDIDEKPIALFVSVDPSGGGPKSDIAIMSAIHYRHEFVIIGLECMPGKLAIRGDYIRYLIRHVETIIRKPLFEDVKIVFSIESNMGMTHTVEASDAMLENFPGRVVSLKKDGYTTTQVRLHEAPKTLTDGGTLGKHTSGMVLFNMYRLYREYLAARAIRFYADCVCIYNTRPQDPNFSPLNETIDLFKRQSIDLLITHKVPNEDQIAFQDVKYTISGKSKGPDDVIKNAKLCLFWSKQYLENEQFRQTGILA